MHPISIRYVQETDAPAIAEIYRPYVEETSISFETEAPSAAEMQGRIGKNAEKFPWLICEDATQILGYAYATQHRERAAYRWSVDVAIYLAEASRGLGLGRQLYSKLIEELRQRAFYNAFAGIALPNAASVALHESLGFERIGVYRSVGFKKGRWHDVGWWQLKLQDYPGSPE